MSRSLLNKTLLPQTIFAFIVFALSVPTYFYLVDWIWMKELDENNVLVAQRIENEFNEQRINESELNKSIAFWNEIQSVGSISTLVTPAQKDSVYTIRRQNPYLKNRAVDRFRGLVTSISINNKNFQLTIETNVEETEETVVYIATATLFFFLVLVVGFWILNKRMSQKLWKPFQDTLQKLKLFQLSKHTPIEFRETDITEFKELNAALDQLLQHSIATYNGQKEFTENASHELQTPLAIIKNKLDLLLQTESLTARQYQIVEEINAALMRMTRINKNLLLLSKIENHQYENYELVNFSDLTMQCLDQFEEHVHNKQINIKVGIKPDINVEANRTLVEILLNNLVLNAIRYGLSRGEIIVNLNEKGLSIANSGTEPLSQTAVFKRFAKASDERVGTGLGLAIVEQICKQHGWSIYYQFDNGLHQFAIRW